MFFFFIFFIKNFGSVALVGSAASRLTYIRIYILVSMFFLRPLVREREAIA